MIGGGGLPGDRASAARRRLDQLSDTLCNSQHRSARSIMRFGAPYARRPMCPLITHRESLVRFPISQLGGWRPDAGSPAVSSGLVRGTLCGGYRGGFTPLLHSLPLPCGGPWSRNCARHSKGHCVEPLCSEWPSGPQLSDRGRRRQRPPFADHAVGGEARVPRASSLSCQVPAPSKS